MQRTYYGNISRNLPLINRIRACIFRSAGGLTLIELMMALAIIGILSGIAIPSYTSYRDKVNNAQAIADIKNIDLVILKFYTEYNRYPVSLNEIGKGGMRDPWDRPYEYLDCSSVKGKGKLRKSPDSNPLNTDYDLYSVGKDGRTTMQVNGAKAHDDLLRAFNGQFVGCAEDLI